MSDVLDYMSGNLSIALLASSYVAAVVYLLYKFKFNVHVYTVCPMINTKDDYKQKKIIMITLKRLVPKW